MKRNGRASSRARPALGLALVCLVVLNGCATTEGRASAPAPGATAPTEANASGDYPLWTRVTGWLLTPFTGASGHVGF